MGLVTIASFDLINSNFVPEEAYFPPVLTVLGVKNEVVELLKQYNGWNKKMYFLLYFTLLVILVLGVILSIVFIIHTLLLCEEWDIFHYTTHQAWDSGVRVV